MLDPETTYVDIKADTIQLNLPGWQGVYLNHEALQLCFAYFLHELDELVKVIGI